MALGGLLLVLRAPAGEELPAVVHASDGQTIYVDFHRRHTRVGWKGEPPVPFFIRLNGQPSVALTFDCAWMDEAQGMKILDFLKARGLRATFFISGPFVFHDYRRGIAGGLNQASLPMIRRMIEDGHEFGSHTRSHPHNRFWINWTRENDDLRQGWDAAVRELFGEAAPANARMLPFWRAPYGEYNDRSLRQASRAGFPIQVGWSVDVHDGLGRPNCDSDPSPDCIDAKRMTDRVLEQVRVNGGQFDGLVVLAHLQNPYDWTGARDGLGHLVDTLSAQGIAIRPLSEMFNWELAPDVGRGRGRGVAPDTGSKNRGAPAMF